MKSITKLAAVTKEQLEELYPQLERILSEQDLEFFKKYLKPYQEFGFEQLDDIYIIAEVTIEGEGEVEVLVPRCEVNQDRWWSYEDEPDIMIDPVCIPFEILLPKKPFNVSGTQTFIVVSEAERNILDSCKDLPQHIRNERKFSFLFWFDIVTKNDEKHEHVNETKRIEF